MPTGPTVPELLGMVHLPPLAPLFRSGGSPEAVLDGVSARIWAVRTAGGAGDTGSGANAVQAATVAGAPCFGSGPL